MNTGQRGDAAVLLASAKLIEAKVSILKPVSESLPFDLVAFNDNKFYKLQVKRAYPSKTPGKFMVSLRRVSMTKNGALVRMYSKEDTDFIIAVIMETMTIYCVPIDILLGRAIITLNPNNLSSKYPLNKKVLEVEGYKNKIVMNNITYDL